MALSTCFLLQLTADLQVDSSTIACTYSPSRYQLRREYKYTVNIAWPRKLRCKWPAERCIRQSPRNWSTEQNPNTVMRYRKVGALPREARRRSAFWAAGRHLVFCIGTGWQSGGLRPSSSLFLSCIRRETGFLDRATQPFLQSGMLQALQARHETLR